MTRQIGVTYKSTIPTLDDAASIEEAFVYYHLGDGIPGENSIEQRFIDINARATSLDTSVGYAGISPAPSPIHNRLLALEVVDTTLASTYIKSAPQSNTDPDKVNIISPTLSTIVPLTILGVTGQTASLQEWKTSGSTVAARVNSAGTLFSTPSTSGGISEVVTLTGTQTLTNKTITNASSVTLTGNQAYTARTRNITLSTSDPSGGYDGDIWIKYVP